MVELNSSYRVTSVLETVDPIVGDDIYLTIDSEMQKAGYRIAFLQGAAGNTGSSSSLGTPWSAQRPMEQYPDYDACFCWYKNEHDNSEIIIFWNPEINRLYIVENII